MTDPFVPAYV